MFWGERPQTPNPRGDDVRARLQQRRGLSTFFPSNVVEYLDTLLRTERDSCG